MVEMLDIYTNDNDSTKYIINLLRGNTMIVTKEFLKPMNVLDIGSIKISSEDYINQSENKIKEQMDNIMFTEVLSNLQ